MDKQIYIDGILREWWSSEARTVTTYDETGAVTSTRPHTNDEKEQLRSYVSERNSAAGMAAAASILSDIRRDITDENIKDAVAIIIDFILKEHDASS